MTDRRDDVITAAIRWFGYHEATGDIDPSIIRAGHPDIELYKAVHAFLTKDSDQ